MSEDRSPYASPDSEVQAPPAEGVELASRGARFGGALIDGLLLLIAYAPIVYFAEFLDGAAGPISDVTATLLAFALAFLPFLAINGYLLATSGQTVGKRFLGMQIVSVEDNRPLPFGKLVGLRYLTFFLVAQIPYIGGIVTLVNPLLIFGEEKRCLHDYVAGTKVIKVSKPVELRD